MKETTTIEISIATANKLHSVKTKLEKIVKKSISYDKVLQIFFITVPIELALEEFSIMEMRK